MNFLQFCVFVNIFFVVHAKLNTPKVLLPYYSEVLSNFTLVASEGCYRWESQRPEIVAIKPVCPIVGSDDCCSTQAIVSAISRSPTRQIAVVTAREESFGHVIRCDVIVDSIKKIEIVTTARELFLEDSPEEVNVIAYDDEGNTFSTLIGLVFNWRLTTDFNASHGLDARDVLRILTFAQSEYDTPEHIDLLERQGKQGDRLLVEGIRTGTALVSARLADTAAYSAVTTSTVRLVVVANLLLTPSCVYLIPLSNATFVVNLLKASALQRIQMPSAQYKLELASVEWIESEELSPSRSTDAAADGQTKRSVDVCSFNEASSTVTALARGRATLSLRDLNLNINEHYVPPMATIHVVDPAFLEITFQRPAARWGSTLTWTLQTSQMYICHITIFDSDGHRIHPSPNIRISVDFGEEGVGSKAFNVLQSSDNGTFHVVRTGDLVTRTHVRARFDSIVLPDGQIHSLKTPVVKTDLVEILEPVRVVPKLLAIPWMFSTVSAQPLEVQPKAYGGSGNYTWSIDNTSVCSVRSVDGLLRPQSLGYANVTVRDLRNPAMFDVLQVVVGVPVATEFVAGRREVVVGRHLVLPLAVLVRPAPGPVLDASGRLVAQSDDRLTAFDCRHLPFEHSLVSLSADGFVAADFAPDANMFSLNEHNSSDVNMTDLRARGACMAVVVSANRLGSATVQSSLPQVAELPAKVVVASYRPLRYVTSLASKARNADKSELRVMVGSAATAYVFGGPFPWVLQPATYTVLVHNSTASSESLLGRTLHDALNSRETELAKSVVAQLYDVNAADRLLSDLNQVSVRCVREGNYSVTVIVTNRPSPSNPLPVEERALLQVTCAVPARVELRPVVRRYATLPPCPLYDAHKRPSHIFGRRGHYLYLALSLFDAHDALIHRHDSLSTDWVIGTARPCAAGLPNPVRPSSGNVRVANLSPTDLDSLVSSAATLRSAEAERFVFEPDSLPEMAAERLRMVDLSVVELAASATCASITVQLRAAFGQTSTSSDDPKRSAQSTDSQPTQLLYSFELVVVEGPALNASEVVLFNQRDARPLILSIQHGSGHYFVPPSIAAGSGHVASAMFVSASDSQSISPDHFISVLPVTEGEGFLQVFDICLDTNPAAECPLRVSGVHQLDWQVGDRVKIGHRIIGRLRLADKLGRAFSVNNIEWSRLVVRASPANAVTVSVLRPADDTTLLYSVHGAQLGQVSIQICTPMQQTVTQPLSGRRSASDMPVPGGLWSGDDNLVCSQRRAVDVFPELRLEPERLYLLKDASFQLSWSGGPRRTDRLDYEVQSGEAAEWAGGSGGSGSAVQVGSGGIVRALHVGGVDVVGRTWPRAVDERGRDDLATFGQARASVHVVVAKALKLRAPITQILVAQLMPVTCFLVASVDGRDVELSPMSFSHLQSVMRFEWSIKAPDSAVAQLRPTNYELGVTEIRPDDFSIHFRAGSRGGVVRVRASVDDMVGGHFVDSLRQLTDEIQIEVLEAPLPLPHSLLLQNSQHSRRPSRSTPRLYLLMAPFSSYDVGASDQTLRGKVNRKLSLQLEPTGKVGGSKSASQGAVTVESGQLLRASGSFGQALLVGRTALHDWGPTGSSATPLLRRRDASTSAVDLLTANFSAALLVKVKPIHYIVVRPQPSSAEGAEPVSCRGDCGSDSRVGRCWSGLPLQSGNRQFVVSFHDDLGVVFDSVALPLPLSMNSASKWPSNDVREPQSSPSNATLPNLHADDTPPVTFKASKYEQLKLSPLIDPTGARFLFNNDQLNSITVQAVVYPANGAGEAGQLLKSEHALNDFVNLATDLSAFAPGRHWQTPLSLWPGQLLYLTGTAEQVHCKDSDVHADAECALSDRLVNCEAVDVTHTDADASNIVERLDPQWPASAVPLVGRGRFCLFVVRQQGAAAIRYATPSAPESTSQIPVAVHAVAPWTLKVPDGVQFIAANTPQQLSSRIGADEARGSGSSDVSVEFELLPPVGDRVDETTATSKAFVRLGATARGCRTGGTSGSTSTASASSTSTLLSGLAAALAPYKFCTLRFAPSPPANAAADGERRDASDTDVRTATALLSKVFDVSLQLLPNERLACALRTRPRRGWYDDVTCRALAQMHGLVSVSYEAAARSEGVAQAPLATAALPWLPPFCVQVVVQPLQLLSAPPDIDGHPLPVDQELLITHVSQLGGTIRLIVFGVDRVQDSIEISERPLALGQALHSGLGTASEPAALSSTSSSSGASSTAGHIDGLRLVFDLIEQSHNQRTYTLQFRAESALFVTRLVSDRIIELRSALIDQTFRLALRVRVFEASDVVMPSGKDPTSSSATSVTSRPDGAALGPSELPLSVMLSQLTQLLHSYILAIIAFFATVAALIFGFIWLRQVIFGPPAVVSRDDSGIFLGSNVTPNTSSAYPSPYGRGRANVSGTSMFYAPSQLSSQGQSFQPTSKMMFDSGAASVRIRNPSPPPPYDRRAQVTGDRDAGQAGQGPLDSSAWFSVNRGNRSPRGTSLWTSTLDTSAGAAATSLPHSVGSGSFVASSSSPSGSPRGSPAGGMDLPRS